MKRRSFIAGLGGAAVVGPWGALGQQAIPVIGYLNIATRNDQGDLAFRLGLAEAGFVVGRNVNIEYRWAEGRHDQLPRLAAELVERRVNLIAAMGGSTSARAAKEATTSIPIVFTMGDADPVQAGIVSSLSKPDGNITGSVIMGGALGVKRVGLIRDMVPKATTFGILANPRNQLSRRDVNEVEAAVRSSGLRPVLLQVGEVEKFDTAFETMKSERVDALVVTADAFFTLERAKIIALAAHHSIPAIYQWRLFPLAGGLMSYGASIADAIRQAGTYAGRILKGEKPTNLPIVLPTKFEMVLNLRTAKTLGLDVPLHLQQLADEVIE